MGKFKRNPYLGLTFPPSSPNFIVGDPLIIKHGFRLKRPSECRTWRYEFYGDIIITRRRVTMTFLHKLITFGLSASLFMLQPCLLRAKENYPAKPLVADLILTGAQVYTANPNALFAEALAIRNGKILAVGQTFEIMRLKGKKTKTMNLKGKQVLPGFIDNHNHIFEAASEAGGTCELSPEATLSEQIPYLQDCLKNSVPEQWIIGWGHTIDLTLSEDEQYTPLEIIDQVFRDRPVIIMEQTSHSMWVNSIALQLAGISPDTPDPQGGKIMKDLHTGELLGILIDNAGDIVMEQAWNSLRNKFTKSYDGLVNGLQEAARYGITTVGDGRLYWKRGWYDVWKALEADGELTARVSLRPWIYPHLPQHQQLDFLKRVHNPNKNTLLIVDQVKMYSDGIIVNGTAKILSPYNFTYFTESPYGVNYIPQAQMTNWLKVLDNIGYGAHIHAIGDGAVRETLGAIGAVRKSGSQRPYTMTHLEMISSADLPRFATLDVDADFQVGSDYLGNADHRWATHLIGKKRSHNLMPLGDVYKTGANVTISSDWNVNPLDPLTGIANAVKLKDKGLPSVEDAINAYTINAANALGLETVTGSIEVGKSADLVILDREIINKSPHVIKQAKVMQTILQGKEVYRIK